MGRFWALVRAQHYVVTFEQLIGLGFSDEWIRHRVATGKLHRIWKGVYGVGRPDLSREGILIAAVLACGPGAAISHAHAAELLKIGQEPRGPIEVSVSADRRHDGIHVHRRKAYQVMRRSGIPVTTVTQTLVDLAPRQTRDEREAMLGQADQRRLTNPEKLRKALDRMPRQPGLKILKQTLDRRDFVMTQRSSSGASSRWPLMPVFPSRSPSATWARTAWTSSGWS